MDRQRKVSLCELLYWQDLDHECNGQQIGSVVQGLTYGSPFPAPASPASTSCAKSVQPCCRQGWLVDFPGTSSDKKDRAILR